MLMNYKITYNNEPDYITKNRIFLKINVLPELFKIKGNKIIFLQEELEKYLSINLQNINIDNLLNINSNVFKELYNTYKLSYKNLTKELFLSTLKIVIKIFLGQKSSELSVIEKITKERKREITKFFDMITPFEKLKYSILSGSFYSKITEPIDLEEVFKTINLDKTFRIVYKGNDEPFVKLYLENEEEIKEFLSSKISNGNFINRNKGLIFKIYQDNHSFTIFLTSTKVSIKYNFVYEDNITFSNIENYNKLIYKLLKKIEGIKYTKINIDFTNIQVYIDKNIDLQKLTTKIDKYKKYLKFEQVIEKRKKKFKIVYTDIFTKEKYSILIKKDEKIIDNHNYVNKILALTILGVKDDYTLNTILTVLSKLFNEVKENTDYKKVANVKQIKRQGVLIDSVSCQKNRQPKLIQSKKSNLQEYSYLNYKENLFVCDKSPYIYPGFTSKDTICCFKKDQKNKPVFIRNISTKKILDEDKDIISQAIKKDKVLEPNRLGYINLFEKELKLYRLGNKQGNKSFLNCINLSKINCKEIDIKELTNSKIYKVLFKNKNYNNDFLSNEQLYELIRYYLKINILIIDTTSSLKPVFICKNLIKEYQNYIVIIKNEKIYELLVQKIGNKLKRFFNVKDNITSILLKKFDKSCSTVKEGITDKFPMSLEEFDSKIIKIQILDKFNKVIFIYTDNYGLIPIYPSQINPLLPYIFLSNEEVQKYILEVNKQYKLLKNSNIPYLLPISQIISPEEKIIGILTSSFLPIPTKEGNTPIKNLPTEKWMKYSLIKYDTSKLDKRKEYINKMKYNKELYERLRYLLSKILPKTNKEITPKFLYNLLVPYTYHTKNFDYNSNEIPITRRICDDKNKACSKDPFCIKYKQKCYLNIFVGKDIYMGMLYKISSEINKNGKLIDIRKELYNRDNFVKRPNEFILNGINDIINFVEN